MLESALMKSARKDASAWVAIPVSVITWVGAIIFTILYVLIGFLILFPITLIQGDLSRRLIHWSAILWARSIIAVTPVWKMRAEGIKNIDPKKTYLIVCNHQSMLDILIVAAKLPVLFKFLAKKELFDVPFLGWHMKLAKYIPVDRSNRTSRHQALVDLSDWLKKGASVLFFPEGTRSLDGEIHEFRAAAFKIARDAGVEILPVVVDGTGDALPKHSWLLKKHVEFQLSVLPSIDMKSVSDDEMDSVKDRVRESMIAKLKELRA